MEIAKSFFHIAPRYLLLAQLLFASWVSAQSHTTLPAPSSITITSGNTPPLTSPSNQYGGYLNHVITAAFNAVNIDVNLLFMSNPRGYLKTKKGEYVATSFWLKSPKHDPYFLYSTALSEENVVLFRLKTLTKHHWNSFEELTETKLILGLTRGFTYTKDIWEYADKHPHSVSIVNTDLQNMQMLMLDRIQAFPVEEVVGRYLLNKHFSEQQRQKIEIAEIPVATKSAHLLFSKAHPNAEYFRQRFNVGMKKLANSGQLVRLRRDLQQGKYD